MKTRIVQLIMFSFVVVSLLTVASMLVVFPPQFNEGCGVNKAYAQPPPDVPPGPPHDVPPGPPSFPVPEPSTLVLLGTGLAAGGGIYSIIRYRRRNKKK
jgi:hypothetical protein